MAMLNRRHLVGGSLLLAAAAVARAQKLTTISQRSDPLEALKGKIFFRSDDNYEPIREAGIWNARKPERYPHAIVLATNETDVIHAVRLARAKGWKVGTRSGGHSWEGTHTRDNSLLINLAKMEQIDVHPAQRIAVISPSTQSQDLNRLLREKHDLMFPTAHNYGVGLGGFVMGGGFGWNALSVGLGCENLMALDLVTADGELIHADESHNSDYLWAARGSGPGFFGVAVRYYLRVHPRPAFQRLTNYIFPQSEIEPVLRWMDGAMERFPRYLEMFALATAMEGENRLLLTCPIHAETEAHLQAVREILATCPVLGKAVDKMVELPVNMPSDTEDDPLLLTGGRFVCDGAWTDAGADEIIPRFLRSFNSRPTPESFVFWQPFVPARTLPDMACSITGRSYVSPTSVSSDPADDARCAAWTQDFIRDFAPISNGGNLNDDNMLMNRQYGNNRRYLSAASAERMKSLLARYDPHGMFGYLTPPA